MKTHKVLVMNHRNSNPHGRVWRGIVSYLGLMAMSLVGLTLQGCGSGGDGGGASGGVASVVTSGSVGNGPTTGTTVPRFAYVTNENENTISIYAVNATSGQLRSLGYVMGGAYPSVATVDPSGRFIYVANQSNSLSAFTINGATGALTAVAGSPYAVGSVPTSVSMDPAGRFVYVSNSSSNTI